MNKLTRSDLEKMLPQIELIEIETIKLNPKNPRTISERSFKALVKSVSEFWQMLFLRPIILDDENMSLGGNQRTLAARKAGFKFVPVIYARLLSDQQRAEFIIKDNNSAGDWNLDALSNDFNKELLSNWGFTLPTIPALSAGNMALDEPTGSTRRKSAEPKADPDFNILVKAKTEQDRDKIVKVLSKAGYYLDNDYYLL